LAFKRCYFWNSIFVWRCRKRVWGWRKNYL